jgi:hypothetical protein
VHRAAHKRGEKWVHDGPQINAKAAQPQNSSYISIAMRSTTYITARYTLYENLQGYQPFFYFLFSGPYVSRLGFTQNNIPGKCSLHVYNPQCTLNCGELQQ